MWVPDSAMGRETGGELSDYVRRGLNGNCKGPPFSTRI